MGFNFVVIFAPGTLEDAPHSFMATISMPADEEPAFSRAVANAFPSVTVIRVKEAVETVAGMPGPPSLAVSPAASDAHSPGIAGLIGALSARPHPRTPHHHRTVSG